MSYVPGTGKCYKLLWISRTHCHELTCVILEYQATGSIQVKMSCRPAEMRLDVEVCCSVLHCVAGCCRVLQGVAGCCSVLQCVAVCRSVSQCVAVCCSDGISETWIDVISPSIYSVLQCVFRYVAVCCSVLQYVAVCCSVLQCVVVCCSVLQCFAVCCSVLLCVAVCCSVLQYVAVCCSMLQYVAVCCSVWLHHMSRKHVHVTHSHECHELTCVTCRYSKRKCRRPTQMTTSYATNSYTCHKFTWIPRTHMCHK